MSDVAIVLSVLGGAMVLFVWNRLPVEVVAIGASLTLAATGVLDLSQAVAGFGDPTVVFIASLFVVSAALDATGVTTWAGEWLTAVAGGDPRRLLVATMLLSALLTAVISVNGAVAALLPMVVVLALRQGQPTSQLMMPPAFAAHAGSMLALTGAPVNVLVSDAAAEAGVGRSSFFEFAIVGVPLLIGTVVITVLFGTRLLPNRTPRSLPSDLSAHARTLGTQYQHSADLGVLARLAAAERERAAVEGADEQAEHEAGESGDDLVDQIRPGAGDRPDDQPDEEPGDGTDDRTDDDVAGQSALGRRLHGHDPARPSSAGPHPSVTSRFPRDETLRRGETLGWARTSSFEAVQHVGGLDHVADVVEVHGEVVRPPPPLALALAGPIDEHVEAVDPH